MAVLALGCGMTIPPTETMTIKTSTALTLATTICYEESFSDIHQAAEFLMGHPIWTHEFDDKEIWNDLRARILYAVPALALFQPQEGAWKEDLVRVCADLGPTVTIQKGTAERLEHPLESMERIAPRKPVIAVEIDGEPE